MPGDTVSVSDGDKGVVGEESSRVSDFYSTIKVKKNHQNSVAVDLRIACLAKLCIRAFKVNCLGDSSS